MANWVIAAKKADFNAIGDRFGIDPVVARILRNRDLVSFEDIELFLSENEEDIHDPFLLNDCERAVSIILQAISDNKKIRIIGDYDVDGVTATFILVKGLKELGADVDYAIPNRILDGYGINEQLIEKAHNDKVELIITCDNGIAAIDAFSLARKKGIQCIITDHHEVVYEINDGRKEYKYPDVDAIINPKRHDTTYPFQGICGAFVAYKLIQAISKSKPLDKDILDELREMAGFGTVCDVMELKDENRILVKLALKDMNESHNVGIRALRKVCELDKKDVTSYQLGFVLGPCINATGRLDSASLSLELLFEESFEAAVVKATELKRLNDMRKDLTEKGIEEAFRIIEENETYKDKVLVINIPTLHESLAGIVAGRIREKYYRPVIVLTETEEGLKGSGRSIDGYNMYEELNKVSNLFTKFGGHKMAAGMSLAKENFSKLAEELNKNSMLTEADLTEKITIDVPMPLGYVSEKLINELNILEPFGTANPKPVFADRSVSFLQATMMGKNGDMAKFKVTTDGRQNFELVLFRGLDKFKEALNEKFGIDAWESLLKGETKDSPVIFDIIYYPAINEFRGKRSIQYILNDYK